MYAKHHVQIILLFVYTTTREGFVSFCIWVFQINLKYHCSKPVTEKFLPFEMAEISHVVV